MASRFFCLVAAAAAAAAATANYAPLADDLARLLRSDPTGGLAPLFIRLAFHQAGTWDAASRVGGATNASMRFPPERDYESNRGLARARTLLEPLARAHGASRADVWSLAAVISVQETGGPTIPWRPGRRDQAEGPSVVPDGRLPDAATTDAGAIRAVFARMGIVRDAQIVALIGAHALGRAHRASSGYDGAWTRTPTRMSHGFFRELLGATWVPVREAGGKLRYTDAATRTLLMLPSDLVLITDAAFRVHVRRFAASRAAFYAEFAPAFAALLELGVDFPPGARRVVFVKRG